MWPRQRRRWTDRQDEWPEDSVKGKCEVWVQGRGQMRIKSSEDPAGCDQRIQEGHGESVCVFLNSVFKCWSQLTSENRTSCYTYGPNHSYSWQIHSPRWSALLLEQLIAYLCVFYGVCVHVYTRDLAVSHIETAEESVHHDKACGKLLSSHAIPGNEAEICRSVDCNSCYSRILGFIYKIQ